MKSKNWFTPDELTAIEKAVQVAESNTSGEIVPCFVKQSDHYELVLWRSFALFTGVMTLVLFLAYQLSSTWSVSWLPDIVLVPVVAAFISIIIFLVPFLKRIFAGRDTMQERVLDRARQNFIDYEVFHTRERTGILIYISFFEKQVAILADSGINQKVDSGAWDQIIAEMTSQMKSGNLVKGISHGILACGELLNKNGFVRPEDDIDELGNELKGGQV